MSFLETIILGIIEGLTEFLPISSTAHLMLGSKLLGLSETDFLKTFEIVIQSGAILAVLFLYMKKILSDFSLLKNILAGFLPTALGGFLFYSFFKTFLSNFWLMLSAMFFGGIFLIVFSRKFKEKNQSLDLKKSFLIGLAQVLAMIPGVSRAMATIVSGMVLGLPKQKAVEFSFLLALPTIASATFFDLYRNFEVLDFGNWQILGLGFLTAFVSALVSVKWFLKFTENKSFEFFGWYRVVLAVGMACVLWRF